MPDHEFAVPGSAPSETPKTNDDFRKLMMTPRAGATPSLGSMTPTVISSQKDEKKSPADKGEKGEKRKKKKSYYAKLKRQEDDKMAELAAKYRDRAKERRDGGEPGRPDDAGGGAYRAVAPDVKGNFDAAERRRQMIQESKYLGGDMEHTHLVKGLDFALLQKVRSELLNRAKVEKEQKELEDIEETSEAPIEEKEVVTKKDKKKSKESSKAPPEKPEKSQEVVKIDKDQDSKVMCKSILAKNIIKTIFNAQVQEKNEMFFPGRMAYIVELEEDITDSSTVTDIPTTIIRSKADIAAGAANQQSLSSSTNDIVINKLTQILSYLRAGKHNKKKKRDRNDFIEKIPETSKKVQENKIGEDLPIYDDVGDYVPSGRSNRDRDRDRDRDRGDRRDRDRDRSDRYRSDRDRDRRSDHRSDRDNRDNRKSRFEQKSGSNSRYFDKDEHEHKDSSRENFSGQDKDLLKKLMKREEEKAKRAEEKKINAEPDYYNECYPGMSEMNDAIDDSDEEVDYSKMDLVRFLNHFCLVFYFSIIFLFI